MHIRSNVLAVSSLDANVYVYIFGTLHESKVMHTNISTCSYAEHLHVSVHRRTSRKRRGSENFSEDHVLRIMREIGNAHVIHILQHATDYHLELARKWEWLR